MLKEYTEDIDFSQKDALLKEFEELLQAAQNSGYETFYVSPEDFVKCKSQQFLHFVFDLLDPKEQEQQRIVADYNKYLARANAQYQLSTLSDIQNVNYRAQLMGLMYPQILPNVSQIFKLKSEPQKQQALRQLEQWTGIPGQLLAGSYLNIVGKLLQIPYDPVDDYLHWDEQGII